MAEVPDTVDLVYIVLPQQHVEEAVKQCVAAGARAACIITAGFSEASSKGRGDEDRLRAIASKAPVCCSPVRIRSEWSMPKSA